ncbi:MAG TPA: competence/damage-inducible protein A [Lachnospiraceae bacterium]|nr:competence/damage-inducible protein A [Lachnospiraceae bacterium]
MTVEIICVGTELLLGNIVNTNAAFLAEKCAELGLSCYYQTVVGDNRERLLFTVKTAMERSDIVLLSGGLGPTRDDLTKETVAEVLGCPLEEDVVSKRKIVEFFEMRGRIPSDNNWKQAMIPKGAIAVDNPNGTAPGVIIEKNGKRIILMPGPPNELRPMFVSSIVPYLKKLEKKAIVSVTVKIVGIGESKAETMVEDLMESQTNPTLAPYAKTCEVHFRVTARADSAKAAMNLNQPMVQELKRRFGSHIYTTDVNVSLEKAVADMLLERKLTMTTAESCTGGMVAAKMISVPGVSEVFNAGFIAYANEAKQKLLGVQDKTLQLHGAVSPQTAEEMARGAAEALAADVAVSVTGIAGPDGGTPQKPVGLVYICCYVKGKVQVEEYHFSGSRMKIRENVTASALIQLRNCLLEIN